MAHINLRLNCQAGSKPYWKAMISFGRRRILTDEVHIETRKRKQGTKIDLGFCSAPVLRCCLNTLISHLPCTTPFHPSTSSRWFYTYLILLRQNSKVKYAQLLLSNPVQSRSEHSKFTFTESSCSQFSKMFKKCSVQQIKVEEVSPLLWIQFSPQLYAIHTCGSLENNTTLSEKNSAEYSLDYPTQDRPLHKQECKTCQNRSSRRNPFLDSCSQATHGSTESWYLIL